MEESLLSTHSEALTEMENFLAGSTGADKVEEAWEDYVREILRKEKE